MDERKVTNKFLKWLGMWCKYINWAKQNSREWWGLGIQKKGCLAMGIEIKSILSRPKWDLSIRCSLSLQWHRWPCKRYSVPVILLLKVLWWLSVSLRVQSLPLVYRPYPTSLTMSPTLPFFFFLNHRWTLQAISYFRPYTCHFLCLNLWSLHDWVHITIPVQRYFPGPSYLK